MKQVPKDIKCYSCKKEIDQSKEESYHFKETDTWLCGECGKDHFETECYSRIVGYIRPVKQWNVGKAEEWKDRKVFKTK